jgi:hypothetical protein
MLNFAFLDKDRQSLAGKAVHQLFGVQCFGHHHAALGDLSRDEQPCREGGRNSRQYQSQGISVAFVGVAFMSKSDAGPLNQCTLSWKNSRVVYGWQVEQIGQDATTAI